MLNRKSKLGGNIYIYITFYFYSAKIGYNQWEIQSRLDILNIIILLLNICN
jgi:hypothetical protein